MNKMINPYRSIAAYCLVRFAGRILISIREPSRGGIGIRLKTASTRLISIPCDMSCVMKTGRARPIFKNKLKATANIIFARGPAKPTQRISFLGFLRPQ
jgi:hypothetical protein